jgi:hypothetical protein
MGTPFAVNVTSLTAAPGSDPASGVGLTRKSTATARFTAQEVPAAGDVGSMVGPWSTKVWIVCEPRSAASERSAALHRNEIRPLGTRVSWKRAWYSSGFAVGVPAKSSIGVPSASRSSRRTLLALTPASERLDGVTLHTTTTSLALRTVPPPNVSMACGSVIWTTGAPTGSPPSPPSLPPLSVRLPSLRPPSQLN